MKAPDVIYVEFSEDVNLAFEKQPFEETPAYIRKEALLEWLKEMRYKTILDEENAFQMVIDKLNEM